LSQNPGDVDIQFPPDLRKPSLGISQKEKQREGGNHSEDSKRSCGTPKKTQKS